MFRARAKPLSKRLPELHAIAEQQERDIATLRANAEILRVERDELRAQLRRATAHANQETRAASRLRVELLARTSIPRARPDFGCDDEDDETTAVLPLPRFVPRRRARDDETQRTIPG